jgi:hypothetical protein
LEGNPTSATAAISAFTIGSLTAKTTPASTDQIVLQDNAASGALKSVPWSSMPGGAGASIGGTITGGTTGSVLFINPTATLAQDNNSFFWNDTSKLLKLAAPAGIYLFNSVDTIDSPTVYERAVLDWNQTSNVFVINTQKGSTGVLRDIYYYTANILALYRIPNVTADNWFMAGAGNLTLSGNSNYAIGAGSMATVTTGVRNIGIGGIENGGNKNLQSLTTGNDNVALGGGCLSQNTTGTRNLAIGTQALINMIGGNNDNVAVGIAALGSLGNSTSGNDNNIGIGHATGGQSVGSGNVSIGGFCGPAGGTNNNQTIIGYTALGAATGGSNSVAIGSSALGNVTSTVSSTAIGGWGGPSGSFNSCIALSYGSTLALDYNYTNASVWTFAFAIAVPGAANPVLTTTAAITTGAGSGAGTLTNAPAAGNPTKWIPINDNGTTRYIPAW